MNIFQQKESCCDLKVFPRKFAYLAKKNNNFGILIIKICILKIFNKFKYRN